MLFTKCQLYRPFGSEEDFKSVFAINVHGGHIGHVMSTASINLGPIHSFRFNI